MPILPTSSYVVTPTDNLESQNSGFTSNIFTNSTFNFTETWQYLNDSFYNASNTLAVEAKHYVSTLNDTMTHSINTIHGYVNTTLDQAINAAPPLNEYWESFKKHATPITDQTFETVQHIAECIQNNPVNTAGAVAGAYLAGKGVSNLNNNKVSKRYAVQQLFAGNTLLASSMYVEGDHAWKLMQLSGMTLASLAVLYTWYPSNEMSNENLPCDFVEPIESSSVEETGEEEEGLDNSPHTPVLTGNDPMPFIERR